MVYSQGHTLDVTIQGSPGKDRELMMHVASNNSLQTVWQSSNIVGRKTRLG